MTDPASIKKSLSAQFSTSFVDMPPPLEQTDPEALASWISRESSEKETIMIVDVRLPEEFATGHIAGAINIPHGGEADNGAAVLSHLKTSEVFEAALASGSASVRVVFTSLQSPDIDDAVAQEFVRVLEDDASLKTSSVKVEVSLLLGGVLHWLRLHKESTTLTQSYVADAWESILSRA